jgi:hypothetical protein
MKYQSDLREKKELTVFGPAPMMIASPEGGISTSLSDSCLK